MMSGLFLGRNPSRFDLAPLPPNLPRVARVARVARGVGAGLASSRKQGLPLAHMATATPSGSCQNGRARLVGHRQGCAFRCPEFLGRFKEKLKGHTLFGCWFKGNAS